VDNRVGWLVMELVVLVVFWRCRAAGWVSDGPALVMALLFTFHYATGAGLSVPAATPGKRMPVVIVVLAVGFNLVNGSLLGAQLAGRRDYRWSGSPIRGSSPAWRCSPAAWRSTGGPTGG